MLILRRREGQYVDVTDREGNTVRIVVLPRKPRSHPCDVELGFYDSQRNFLIQRPDRRPEPSPREGPRDFTDPCWNSPASVKPYALVKEARLKENIGWVNDGIAMLANDPPMAGHRYD